MHKTKRIFNKAIAFALCGMMMLGQSPMTQIHADEIMNIPGVEEEVQTPDELVEEILNGSYHTLGNSPSNIKNNDRYIYAYNTAYFANDEGIFYLNAKGNSVKVSSKAARYLNAMDHKFYFVGGGKKVYSCDLSGKNIKTVFTFDAAMERMYVVDSTYIFFISNGDLYRYDMTTDELSAPVVSGIVDYVPTKDGILLVKGSLNNFTIIVNDKVCYSGVYDYYVSDGMLQMTIASGNTHISLATLFDDNKSNKAVSGSYGEEISAEAFIEELEETDDNIQTKGAEDFDIEGDAPVSLASMDMQTMSTNLSSGQKNCVKRAYSMVNLDWKPLKSVTGWKGRYTFNAGTTYTGTPYAQNVSQGAYIGYGISVEGFKYAIKDINNPFYTSYGYNAYAGAKSTYYGSDCSGFVSYCWDMSRRTCTYLKPVTTKLGTDFSVVQVGDCLNNSDHVILITQVQKNSAGTIVWIETSEQTTPLAKHRNFYSVSELAAKCNKDGYILYRYEDVHTVPPSDDDAEDDPTVESQLTIAPGYTYPERIEEGTSFSLRGNVTSNFLITKVQGTIRAMESGEAVITSTQNPYSTSTTLAKINTEIKFGTLPAGDYKYILRATDMKGTKTLISKQFTVYETEGSDIVDSELKISDYTYPETLELGSGFGVRGLISSNYKISKVVVAVKDADKKNKIVASATPDSFYYDLIELNSKVIFGKLPAGEYTYLVKATDTKGTLKLINKKFVVKGPSDVASTMKAYSYSYPTRVIKGNSFSLYGTITSNFVISKVSAMVVTPDGKTVIKADGTPNAKEYSIGALNSAVKFGTLNTGYYYYKVIGTDTKGTKTLVRKRFYVGVASTKNITSYTTPDNLKLGSGFGVRGIVSSNYNLQKVTISVVDDAGNAVIKVSATPKIKKYDLINLNSQVKFGTLKEGTYTYKIAAKDVMSSKVLVSKVFRVGNGSTASTLCAKDYSYPTTIKKGSGFGIYGKIVSNYAITDVSVYLVDSKGKDALTVKASCNTTIYDLANLNSQIKFGGLDRGNYTYKVVAKDTKQTKTVISKNFVVQ